jgi:hypothetical protein
LKETREAVERYQKRREVIRKLIGERRVPKVKLVDGRVVEVEKGQVIELFVHEQTQKWVRSEVVGVFRDELGNSYYTTAFHLYQHLLKDNFKKLLKAGLTDKRNLLSFIQKAIAQPQVIVHDIERNAVLFGRKATSGDWLLLPVAGIQSGKVDTILVRKHKFQNEKRYKIEYSEVEG